MGGFSNALTKPGLLYGDGSANFFPSQQDALNAVLPLLQQNANGIGVNLQPPTSTSVTPPTPAVPPMAPTDDNPPQLQTQGGGPELSAPSTAPLPKFFKPTYAQALNETPTDNQGRPVGVSPGLTKLGFLMNLLHGAAQGGVDAMASGALNAAPGKSGFGSGVEGAVMMPLQRAQMARQIALANQEMALKGAQTNLANADAQAKGTIILPRGGAQAYNTRTGQVVATAPQTDKNFTMQNLYAQQMQELQGMDTADPAYAQKAAALSQTAQAIKALQPNNTKPLTQQQADALNATWDPIAKRSGLPAGQFRAGMAGTEATQLQTGLNDAIGKQQGATRVNVLPQQTEMTHYFATHPGATSEDYEQFKQNYKGGMTAAQRGAIETTRSNALNKLHQNYTHNPQTGMYEAKDGTQKTAEEYQQLEDDIENARFDRYLAGGETPPDLSVSSGTPALTPAHGNSATPAKSALPPPLAKAAPTQKNQQPPKTAAPKGQLTDPKIALSYLQKAGGNKDRARQLAASDGYSF